MTRLVVAGAPLAVGITVLPPAAAHHARVARLRPGDPVELLNLQGLAAAGVLLRWEGEACVVAVQRLLAERGEPPAPLVLALAVLHTEAFAWAVEKATELGATAVQPVLCHRVQGREHARRLERWRRVAAAAVAQCGRTRAPEVRPPLPLAEACTAAVGMRLYADPTAASAPPGPPAARAGATVLVGPEGGLTPAEAELVRARGFASLWLGPRTLRAETAAVAGLVLAQHLLGWLATAPQQAAD